ncbi:MAG: S41 family peptidase [Blastocatellia bacterium]|nr:S41 family peptidase [Blastocatellia bacterium]
MRKFTLTALLLLALLLTSGAQGKSAYHTRIFPEISGSAARVDTSPEVRRKTFEIVWRTVKERHFDPDLGGVDWDAVHERYAPRIAAVTTDSELYDLLRQMLGELGQSHFNIIPPEAIVEDGVKEPPTGGIGIDLQMIEGLAVITQVEKGSAADRAGLRTGYIIKQVDSTPVTGIAAQFAKSNVSAAIRRLRITRGVVALVNGKPGTSVRIVYLDGRNRPMEAICEREKLKGEMSRRVGQFPPRYTEFESKRLTGRIGYIRFNTFALNLMDRIRHAISDMRDAPGIIVDLRGNPGGIGNMSNAIASLLETRRTTLGIMRTRTGEMHFAVFPREDAYRGAVVIMIDGRTGSTSEIMAAGMQESGRAILVGERSVGAALPSVFEKLPTGALFQFAIADFKTPKGRLIEGNGVTPDIEVLLTRAVLLEGRDPQLEEAISQIRKRTSAASRQAAGF